MSPHERDLTTDDTTATDSVLDPAERLRLVADTRARTHQALAPDERLLFGAWGIAWFVGFGAMWLSSPSWAVAPWSRSRGWPSGCCSSCCSSGPAS